MAFWTPSGLAALRPTEGQYGQIHNNTPGGATGGFGFLDSTWRTFAPQAGVDLNQYPRAYMAPPSVQDKVASITPISNWTCPDCNTSAVQLARNPAYVTDSPIDPSGSGPGSGTGYNLPQVPDYSGAFDDPNDFPKFGGGDQYAPAYTDTPGLGGGIQGTGGYNPFSGGSTPVNIYGTGANTSLEFDPSSLSYGGSGSGFAGGNGASFSYGGNGSGVGYNVQDIGFGGGGNYGAGGDTWLQGFGADISNLDHNVTQGIFDSIFGGGSSSGSATGNSGASSTDFFQTFINDFWNVAQRGGLIILGIVLIAVGGYWLASQSGKLQLVKG